jgi:hypothetical protein
MKYYLLPVLSFLFMVSAKAADKDSVVISNLPDSVKGVQFMTEINVRAANEKRSIGHQCATSQANVALFGRGRYRVRQNDERTLASQ